MARGPVQLDSHPSLKNRCGMDRRAGLGFGAAVALLAAGARLCGQVPDPASVLAKMERVADWQLSHPSAHDPTDWTQAAGDAGFMALAGISANPAYRDAMVAVGEKNKWQPGPRLYHADDHCIGQTYGELYLLYREPGMIAPLRARFDSILEKPSGLERLEFGQPANRATEKWSWCDALFMGPPTWARLSAATGDARYLDFAVKNWWLTTDYLYDKEEHLIYRDSTYYQKREANGQKIFWSRGNGWVIAGLVRVLQYLPSNHPDRPRFERLFADMSEKVLSCQQPDGLWRASLLDPGDYPMRETSGSGFYAYALAWGVNQGLLDRSRFEPAALKAWAALDECVLPDGKLTHVQPIGADPKKFLEGSTEVYGVGAFLLAGSEIYRMAVLGGTSGSGRQCATVQLSVTNPSVFGIAPEETVEIDARILRHPGAHGFAVMDGDFLAHPGQPGLFNRTRRGAGQAAFPGGSGAGGNPQVPRAGSWPSAGCTETHREDLCAPRAGTFQRHRLGKRPHRAQDLQPGPDQGRGHGQQRHRCLGEAHASPRHRRVVQAEELP